MPSRTGLLLLLLIVAAVSGVAWMLLGDDLAGSGGEIGREGQGEGDPGEVIDFGDPLLAGASGARSAKEIEAERAAREAAAQAPTFPRAEGVFGRVTDAGGRGVDGATVKLTVPKQSYTRWGLPDPEPIATTTTDADGNFLVGPAPFGILRLRAEAPGYAPTVKPLKRRGYRVDVILDRGGALEVLVKNTKGEGVAEARVIHQAGVVVTEVLTNDQGLAAFPGLPTGSGQLFISAEGYAGMTQSNVGVAPGKTEHRTVVLGKPLVIDGKVLESESEVPVVSARIRIRYPSMPWIDETTGIVSDEDGRFEIEVPLPIGQSLDVEVLADGYAPQRSWFQASDSGAGRMTLEIKLVSGERGGVRGEVVDYRGLPIGGVRVLYVEERSGQTVPETKTRQDGSFSLPPVPWASRRGSSAQIAAISDVAGVGTAWARMPKKGDPEKPVTIRMSGTGAIQGKVVDGAGQPVAGALVSVQIDWRTTMQMPRLAGSPQPWNTWGLVQNPRYVLLDQVTDDAGRFTIEGVPLACYLVTASFGLDATTAEEPTKVEAGVTATCDITLGDGGTIEGFVRDVEGLAVAGAHVSARPEGDRTRGMSPSLSARSQSDGRFVLHGASRETYSIRATATGYESKRQTGVRSGSSDTTLELQPLGWIDGVVSYEGRPHQGTFTVTARSTEAPDPRGMSREMLSRGSRQSNSFNTDDGTFRLGNLRGGEYEVAAQTPEGLIALQTVRAKVTIGRGSRVQLSLVGGGRIEGSLVTDATGAPIANAQVSARAVPGPDAPVSSAHARTDAGGKFILRGLQTGRYSLNIWPPSGIRVRRVLDVRAGEVQVVRIREESPGEVHIYVRDNQGRAVAGARPSLKTEAGDQEWPNWTVLRRNGYDMRGDGWSKILQTDENGRNVRPFTPIGRYQVGVQKAGFETVDAPWIEVTSGRTVEVEVVIRPVAR